MSQSLQKMIKLEGNSNENNNVANHLVDLIDQEKKTENMFITEATNPESSKRFTSKYFIIQGIIYLRFFL